MLQELQRGFAAGLSAIAADRDDGCALTPVDWLRDDGRHGGGTRLCVADSATFNRASVNFSHVHYEDLPDKRLRSATALSTIIHPAHPRAPSMHMHISWTELRAERSGGDGGYWRIMADLNPAIEQPPATAAFEQALASAAPAHFDAAKAQGERYFFIPALGRHRGVAHFYLEGYRTERPDDDERLAQRVGQCTVAVYLDILRGALTHAGPASDDERSQQLAYHSLYFLQVLTLDRGTTSGLLVHDQNDLGIMGSIPARVDRQLLHSWIPKLPPPQDTLLQALVDTLEDAHPSPVTDEVRLALAQVVRAHYLRHPEALSLQAAGDTVPPTVQNHR